MLFLRLQLQKPGYIEGVDLLSFLTFSRLEELQLQTLECLTFAEISKK